MAESRNKLGMSAETYGKYKIYYPIFGEAKIDGRRLFIVIRNSKPAALAHSGFDVTDRIPNICANFVSMLSKYKRKNGVFDIEVTAELKKGDEYTSTWAKTGMLFTRAKNEAVVARIESELEFAVFDFVSLDIFEASKFYEDETTCVVRDELLRDIIDYNTNPNIFYVMKEVLHNEQEIDDYYAELLDFGFEGTMLKDMQSSYKNKERVASWLKRKPEATEDFSIIDFELGSNKNSNRLGKITVHVPGAKDTLRVGGGFKDKPPKKQIHYRNLKGTKEEFQKLDVGTLCDRETIWKFRNFLKGYYIEVKYQDDKQSVTKTRRSPRFIRFRPDKTVKV